MLVPVREVARRFQGRVGGRSGAATVRVEPLHLCTKVRSKRWLISTNGERFGHPDPDGIAWVIVTQRKPELVLSYVTEYVDDLICNGGDWSCVRSGAVTATTWKALR
jgi:hypothetical protein